MRFKRGFTLIELLIVIAIIGLLSTIVVIALNQARQKARDARRLGDMQQIHKALELFYDKYLFYPSSDGQGPGGWETPADGDYITALVTEGLLSAGVRDPGGPATIDGYPQPDNYHFYRYGAGDYGCDPTKGAYFVLGVVRLESQSTNVNGSPGWACPSRDWQGEMRWVVGGFERP